MRPFCALYPSFFLFFVLHARARLTDPAWFGAENHRARLRPRGARIVVDAMAVHYRYELRRGEEIVATGHLAWEEPLQVGDRVVIAGKEGIVRSLDPVLGEPEWRVVVQLLHDGA